MEKSNFLTSDFDLIKPRCFSFLSDGIKFSESPESFLVKATF